MKHYNNTKTYSICDELKNLLTSMRENQSFNPRDYIQKKANLLNDYFRSAKLDSVVIGVSGGIDSAVALGLAVEASKVPGSPIKRIYPVMLPCMESSGVTNQNEARSKGEEVCIALGVKGFTIDIANINNAIRASVEGVTNLFPDDWAIGQLVPYSRTPVLYYLTSLLSANNHSGIVLGTTNLSEGGYLGYVGKASDAMVDVQIISDIYKSQVYEVAAELHIPDNVINAVPNGDMYDSRTDIEVFGASYDFVELYQRYLSLPQNTRENVITWITRVGALNEFNIFAGNLESLHRYNRHKYLVGSPAVHLDLWPVDIPDGWHHVPWEDKKWASI